MAIFVLKPFGERWYRLKDIVELKKWKDDGSIHDGDLIVMADDPSFHIAEELTTRKIILRSLTDKELKEL